MDYRGEIKVILYNATAKCCCIEKGERIAQMVIAKYEKVDFVEVEELSETERASGGLGHTGNK